MRSAGYGSDEELTPADTRYYRRWLHELAPLQHGYRKIEVDVHFRLLPMADRRTFATNDQLGRSVPIEGSRFRILDPVDRVLHSILNLSRIGDFRRAIRDLWDLRCMVESLPRRRPRPTTGIASMGSADTAFQSVTASRFRRLRLAFGRGVSPASLYFATLSGVDWKREVFVAK